MLNLPNVFVETNTIKEAYELVKEMHADDLEYLKKAKEASECLSLMKCREQYTRFGNTLRVDIIDAAEIEFDWKLLFSISFFALFSLSHASMAKTEQKPGLRFGSGVGIIFCANEIQILSSAAAQIQYGQKPDPAIKAIVSIFPP